MLVAPDRCQVHTIRAEGNIFRSHLVTTEKLPKFARWETSQSLTDLSCEQVASSWAVDTERHRQDEPLMCSNDMS